MSFKGSKMKIVFIGSTFGSLSFLKRLEDLTDIVGVVGQEKSPNDDFFDLRLSTNNPFRYGTNAEWIASLNPDYIFVCGWNHIIKPDILNIAPTIGLHYSLLPEGRGCSPVIWATVKKLKKTGVTWFWMDEEVDTGDILYQREAVIEEGETAKSLYYKLVECALNQLNGIIPSLKAGIVPRIPQDNSKATYWRKRTKEKDEWIAYL